MRKFFEMGAIENESVNPLLAVGVVASMAALLMTFATQKEKRQKPRYGYVMTHGGQLIRGPSGKVMVWSASGKRLQ